MPRQPDEITRDFLSLVFGEHEGYLALASKGPATPTDNGFRSGYFLYPTDTDAALGWINEHRDAETNLYFSPMLYGSERRVSEEVTVCPVLWADLDEADPEHLRPQPHIVLSTSPGRWQALWRLRKPAPPQEAAQASKRLAYTYGADPSGWDLTQLLRLPATINAKYKDKPIVQIENIDESGTIDISEVLALPEVPTENVPDIPFPSGLPSYEEILKRKAKILPFYVIQLHDVKPTDDFSKALWNLELNCLEAGLTPEETFVFADTSEANKYRRDGRSPIDLWKEVCKAVAHIEFITPEADITIPELITKKELRSVSAYTTFVDRYVRWASERTDAPPQFHQAGGFVILSAILAENIRLALAHTDMVPNLWFMMLGDSTTSRKTTAMEMALQLLNVVYDESYLASESSVEGLLTALSERRGLSSIFARDEFSGMLESMKRKDYFAGMSEMLARLYDGRREKRVLRHQTYDVRDPVLILFCGGAKSRIYSLLNDAYIRDGFVPRFVFVTTETDVTRIKAIQRDNGRLELLSSDLAAELSGLRSEYDVTETITLGEQALTTKAPLRMDIDQDALDRYNTFERVLLLAAQDSVEPDVWLPVMDRLAKSGLKVATLIAAARSKRSDAIVKMPDVLKAISYVVGWMPYTQEVVENIGKTLDEHTISRIMQLLYKGRTQKTDLLRSTHIPTRELEFILEQMEARGMVVLTRRGKTLAVTPTTPKATKVRT